MLKQFFTAVFLAAIFPLSVNAAGHGHGHEHEKESHANESEVVSDEVIAQQRANLAENTTGKGFGPQSPRDIDSIEGANQRIFNQSPGYAQMNLCNIHFHKNAEHKGGEFNTYAGNGDGKGFNTGYVYSGELTEAETAAYDGEVCPSKHGGLYVGDTIEVHYVHSSAQIAPGPTLGSCLNDSIGNPQLRVETQVFVLVNDAQAEDFVKLAAHEVVDGYHQAINMLDDMGDPIQYTGSTTGPGYNEKGSPFQVSWSVRPKVAKLNIDSVATWCKGNTFNEDHAHGVRNLVINPDLLSEN